MPKKSYKKNKDIFSQNDITSPPLSKISEMLPSYGVTKELVCKTLCSLLTAVKPVIADGEIIAEYDDNMSRLKAVEVILDIYGERKDQPLGDADFGDKYITNIIGSFNRDSTGEISESEQRRIEEVASILRENLSSK